MYSQAFLLLIVVLTLWSESAVACNRRRRPPPPPPPPPPGSPPVPPPPPPVVKVVRQREQKMTRNNCKKVEITTANNDVLNSGGMEPIVGASAEELYTAQQKLKNEGRSDQCLTAEQFKYVCEFSVFSEIALTTIYHPTGCGCAFTISVVTPRPRTNDVANLMSVNAAYSTKVTRFAIVVYDHVADQVQREIPEFSNMALSPETTAMIEAQVAADPNGEFSSITAGFAGVVKSMPKLPEELDLNNPANANYIPAIQFTIEQVYTTGAMFKVPCVLKMHEAPNAYVSQCQPYRPEDAHSYSKRHSLTAEETEASTDKAWFREFYLFPKQDAGGCGQAASGYTPKSRYITAIYNDNKCTHEHGYMSFDREFESTFTASNAVVGGWQWARKFEETRIVYGVPHSFSTLTAVWCLGYSQITWVSPSGFESTNVPIEKGVCTKVPTTGGAKQDNKYGEVHKSFPTSAETTACTPVFNQECGSDITLLGFQNEDPRDFEKRKTSVLLTGPRKHFCSEYSQEGNERVVFDTLTFRGVKPGDSLAKRNLDDSEHPEPHQFHMIYSDEHDGLLHGHHAPELVARFNAHRRKRGEKEMLFAPVAGPHRDNFGLNNAAGSVDIKGSDGASAGDHPMRVFPETYSAPLTLDPVQSASEKEPLVYEGELVNGTPPKFCDIGDIGCACRGEDEEGSPCDHPFECNSEGYCVRPPCPAGKPGCAAHSDGTCDDELVVDANKFCVYKPSCELGSIGCACDAKNQCGDQNAECVDNQCIVPKDGVCADGNPGCDCNPSDGSCQSGASCDAYSGLCMFQSCKTGSRGCQCQKKGAPCEEGFVCSDEGSCVVAKCTPGDAGCQCLGNKKCNTKGFTCVELNRDGSENVCVGQDLCAEDQTSRCVAECGPGNVQVCGKCSYSQPICRDASIQYCNKNSYLYMVEPCETISASSAFMSLAAVLIALLAAF